MQEQEQEKMVDIDTSGPGIEVELPEEKENENVQTNNDTVNNVDTSDQSVDASSSVEEKTKDI